SCRLCSSRHCAHSALVGKVGTGLLARVPGKAASTLQSSPSCWPSHSAPAGCSRRQAGQSLTARVKGCKCCSRIKKAAINCCSLVGQGPLSNTTAGRLCGSEGSACCRVGNQSLAGSDSCCVPCWLRSVSQPPSIVPPGRNQTLTCSVFGQNDQPAALSPGRRNAASGCSSASRPPR